MARLRYDNLFGTLGSSLNTSGTSLTFSLPPTYKNGVALPAVASPDYLPISIDESTNSYERVWITAYAGGGATTATIIRGQEGTSGVAHSNGAAWNCAPGVADFGPTVVSGGSLGSTYTLALESQAEQTWLYGTLTANLALTISNFVAGSSVKLLALQDSTGSRTLSVNGASVAINGTASTLVVVDIYSPDGTDLDVQVAGGVTGPAGPAGPAGAGGLTFTAKSGNYTAVGGDFVQMTGAHTVTLPTPTAGAAVGVLSVNGSGSAPCTIFAPSGVILGKGVAASAASILLGDPGAFVILEADGTNWNIIAGCQDSGWITPGSFTNSWVNGTPPVQYRLQENRVVFRGQMSSGTINTTAFTLPAGYRPVQSAIQTGIRFNGGSFAFFIHTLTSGGAVQPNATDAAAVYLENASFLVD